MKRGRAGHWTFIADWKYLAWTRVPWWDGRSSPIVFQESFRGNFSNQHSYCVKKIDFFFLRCLWMIEQIGAWSDGKGVWRVFTSWVMELDDVQGRVEMSASETEQPRIATFANHSVLLLCDESSLPGSWNWTFRAKWRCLRPKQSNPGFPWLPTTQSFYFVFFGGLRCQSHKSCVIIYDCSWGLMCLADNYHNAWEQKKGNSLVSEGCHVFVSKKDGWKNASVKEPGFISAKCTKTTHFHEKTLHGRPLHPKKKTLPTCNKHINNSCLVTKNLQTMSGVKNCHAMQSITRDTSSEHKIVPNHNTLKVSHLRNFNQTHLHTECRSTNENVLGQFLSFHFFPFQKIPTNLCRNTTTCQKMYRESLPMHCWLIMAVFVPVVLVALFLYAEISTYDV